MTIPTDLRAGITGAGDEIIAFPRLIMESPRKAQVHIPSPRCDLSDSDERLAPVLVMRSRSQSRSITGQIGRGKRTVGQARRRVTELDTESVWPDLETYLKPQETRQQVWGTLLSTGPVRPSLKFHKRKEYMPKLSHRKESLFPAKSRPSPCSGPLLFLEFSTPKRLPRLSRSPLQYLTRKQLHREPTIWKSPLGQYEYVDGSRRKGHKECNKSYFL